ncbi:saccharopine dehydrogenase NADP-binding domain-containing protein [Porticoccaceae bacterium LTM1]|nr:saccharopine dehydrogenase NADP-binding domain-containing protein [Porticoccaceae bacterium LTM1]
MSVKRIVILGGYGNFGKRIAEQLAKDASLILIIAGRSAVKAESICQKLNESGARASLACAPIDLNAANFTSQLADLKPDLVIHTSGPFQGQDYRVPKACIACGCHYVDLSDDRRFVCDIDSLDQAAKAAGVQIISGASSVPGLSSVVIDQYRDQFQRLDSIDFAIAPGNKADRGEATVKGILSYTGHPFPVYENGSWQQRYGWMSIRRWNFGDGVGKRWLANVDVPDLELFPTRYSTVQTVRFQAGLELPILHLSMSFMAWLCKIKLVKNWLPLSGPIFRLSNLLRRFGTDIGGMRVTLFGEDKQGKPLSLSWKLNAANGIGPYIPTFSTILVAKKLVAGQSVVGATPCLGMYSMAEFDQLAKQFGIHHSVSVEKETN